MGPLSELRELHQQLCRKLHRYSFVDTIRLVAGMGVLPQFHANTVRLELLSHLAATECQGANVPNRDDLVFLLKGLELGHLEDPVEDVFVGCVNTMHGTFRLFSGIFADGYFIVERLFGFLAPKVEFPTFQETVDSALALLRLSDALAKRVGLTRNCAGGGSSSGKIDAPPWRVLEPAARAVSFSQSDLHEAGILLASLEEFILSDEQRTEIQNQRMYASNLERRPLVRYRDGVVVAEPSTISRALVRYMLERIQLTKMGGWAETLFHQENAGIFVNDVARHLRIEDFKGCGLDDITLPNSPEHLPALFPYFGSFDYGKPVIMLSHTSPMEPAVAEPDGMDEFSDDEVSAMQTHLQACADAFARSPNFSGGMVLFSCVGLGRWGSFPVLTLGDSWVVHAAPLPDWLALSGDAGCTAMRLWKLGMQEKDAERRNVHITNLGGLPSLYEMWKRGNYCLFPIDTNFASRNVIGVGCEFGETPRTKFKLTHDIHHVRSHDDSKYVCLHRLHPTALFEDDEKSRSYGDIDAAKEHRLVACIKAAEDRRWWVVAPNISAPPVHMDVMFQLWDCVVQWLERSLTVIEREFPKFRPKSVEVLIELPDFVRWNIYPKLTKETATTPLIVAAPTSKAQITLTVPEGFLPQFNQSENVAERGIVAALIKGVALLSEMSVTPEKLEALALEVTRGTNARFFHIVESKHLQTNLRRHRGANPLFVPEEDAAMVNVGLADLAGRPPTEILTGKEACQKFLHDTVVKVRERIEKRLSVFDRFSVVMACCHAIDEISRDMEHFDMTTRSILALHQGGDDANAVLRNRRSRLNLVEFGNRLIIETAQYAAASTGGRPLNSADHGGLLAEFELLLTLAHHCEAIVSGFIEPEIKIHPRGDIEVDEKFYNEVMRKYLSQRSDRQTGKAAENYDSYFPQSVPAGEAEPAAASGENGFAEIFEGEFGFSTEQLSKVLQDWHDVAVGTKQVGGLVLEEDMYWMLGHAGMTREQSARFISTLTLPVRSAWDKDLPNGCRKDDVFPWRFRRRISVLMRPLIQISTNPKSWVVWVPVLEKSMRYLMGNITEGRFPDQFFTTQKMRSYIGSRVDKHGHEFAIRVEVELKKLGFATRLEIKMTELGAPSKPDLGDVDVLAWIPGGEVVCVYAIECKRLTAALTVREIVQRLEEFRGDEKRRDSLGKHIHRINWLVANVAGVAKTTGIPVANVKLIGLLVCSDLVPMQFFKEMNFPTAHVLPFDELSRVSGIL